MTTEELAAAVLAAVRATVDAGGLVVSVPDRAVVRRPKSRDHGDYATNVALRLAGPAGRRPREVAELVAGRLREHPGLARVDVAGPGFLNLTLATGTLAGLVRTVLEQGAGYGRGGDPDRAVDAVVGRPVTLRGGRTSERAGPVTLDEAAALLGTDALRYALVRRPAGAPVDLDVDVWASRTDTNPLFRVQHAHARLASLGRNARELGIVLPAPADIDYGLLRHEREGDLLRALGEFPRVVAAAAERRAPHRIARYLEELAGMYDRFDDACRVLPGDHEDLQLVHARLALCEATRTVLANGLSLLGVSAPDRI